MAEMTALGCHGRVALSDNLNKEISLYIALLSIRAPISEGWQYVRHLDRNSTTNAVSIRR
jgi:hypothetical protein